jgi:hypothetical protein
MLRIEVALDHTKVTDNLHNTRLQDMISISVYMIVLVIKHSKIEKAPKLVEVIDGGVSPLPILICCHNNCLFIVDLEAKPELN